MRCRVNRGSIQINGFSSRAEVTADLRKFAAATRLGGGVGASATRELSEEDAALTRSLDVVSHVIAEEGNVGESVEAMRKRIFQLEFELDQLNEALKTAKQIDAETVKVNH